MKSAGRTYAIYMRMTCCELYVTSCAATLYSSHESSYDIHGPEEEQGNGVQSDSVVNRSNLNCFVHLQFGKQHDGHRIAPSIQRPTVHT